MNVPKWSFQCKQCHPFYLYYAVVSVQPLLWWWHDLSHRGKMGPSLDTHWFCLLIKRISAFAETNHTWSIKRCRISHVAVCHCQTQWNMNNKIVSKFQQFRSKNATVFLHSSCYSNFNQNSIDFACFTVFTVLRVYLLILCIFLEFRFFLHLSRWNEWKPDLFDSEKHSV